MTKEREPAFSALARFRPYPEYKDSGIEWLGEIPAHWEIRRLKTRASVQLSNVDKKSVEGQQPVSLCNYIDVYYNEQITKKIDFMVASATPDQVLRFTLRVGDVLITKDSESWTDIAVPAVVTEDLPGVLCGYHLALLRPAESILDGRFLARACAAIGPRDQFQIAANGITRFGLTGDAIRTAVLGVPPLLEQRSIAAFLDRETTKIDALVTKKERVIELLQEKHTALITRAVTKGLDPNVSMKDSGVGWLDQIPAHWVVLRLKFLLRRIEQGWSPLAEQREASEDEWAVLKVGCVNEGRFDQAEHKALPAEMTPPVELEIHEGDILVSRANTRELLGSAAVVTNVRPRLLLCDKLYRLTVDLERIEPRYVVSLLATRSARHQLEVEAVGASNSMQNIKQGTIGNLVVAVPQRLEQVKILGFIEQEAGRIDGLTTKIREGIGRLKEYRTALISAAVTGKIDVRGA